MEFLELTGEEFCNVCDNMIGNSFYQSCSWAKVKASVGWIHYYVGVKNEGKIVACALILGKRFYLNKYMFYAPRGFLLDYDDFELLSFFTLEVKKFLISKGGYMFKIDPLVQYKNHDKMGNDIQDGFCNQEVINNLIKLGYKHRGFTIGYSSEAQFRWSYCLDINRSFLDIYQEMDQRCRRCIRKYEKYPLKMVDVNDDNIVDFKAIMEHTAKRQNHFDRSISYYQSIRNEFGVRVKMVIIYLDKTKFLSEFIEDKLYELVKKEDREMIPISAGLFLFDKDRLNYVYGGTYQHYMPLMAQYKLQMEMICLAKEKNISLYDFGGISGNFESGSKNYGIYEFKRGFGGYVVEYIGEFDYILDKAVYNFYNVGYKLYRDFKCFMTKL